MITKQKQLFYFVGERPFKDLADAQAVDLMALMDTNMPPEQKASWASWLLKNSDAIVDTLTTTPKSRLKGRKSHGATRKKKQPNELAKTNPVPA